MSRQTEDDLGKWLSIGIFLVLFIAISSLNLGVGILSVLFWLTCLAGSWLLDKFSGRS